MARDQRVRGGLAAVAGLPAARVRGPERRGRPLRRGIGGGGGVLAQDGPGGRAKARGALLLAISPEEEAVDKFEQPLLLAISPEEEAARTYRHMARVRAGRLAAPDRRHPRRIHAAHDRGLRPAVRAARAGPGL